MAADGAQRHHAHGGQVAGALGLKQAQQRFGDEQEGRRAHGHDDHGQLDGDADGVVDALAKAGAVVVAHDSDHAVAQAKDRHEDEGLELEVDDQDADGGDSVCQ